MSALVTFLKGPGDAGAEGGLLACKKSGLMEGQNYNRYLSTYLCPARVGSVYALPLAYPFRNPKSEIEYFRIPHSEFRLQISLSSAF